MIFTCPREACGQTFDSLRKIKSHMSRIHGGFDDEELAAIVGGSPGEAGVRERMAGFADAIPLGGSTFEDAPSKPGSGTSGEDRPPEPEAKRVKATPKKAKKLVAGLLEKLVVALKIKPDNEDKETLEEASNFLSDMFGVEFSIPQSKYVVESRFWAFVWVAAVVGIIYIKHNFKTIFMTPNKDGVYVAPGEEGASSGTESSVL